MSDTAYKDLCEMLEYARSERCLKMFQLLCPEEEEARVLASFKEKKAPHNTPLTVKAIAEKLNLAEDKVRQHLESLLKKGVVANIGPDIWAFGPYAAGCVEDITDGIVYAVAMQYYDREKDEITDPHQKALTEACLEFVDKDWYYLQRVDELLHGRQLLLVGKKPMFVPNITALEKSGIEAKDYPQLPDIYFLKERAKKAKTLAATPCPCRFRMGMTTEYPMDTCVFMDMGASEAMTYRLDREIEVGNRIAQTVEEYLEVQCEGERKGMVHSSAVCLCEDKCCNEFNPLIKYASIKEGFVKTPFRAIEKAPEACVGCGICTKHCRFEAIHMVDGKPVIDPAMCYGCGACVTMCPHDVHVLTYVG